MKAGKLAWYDSKTLVIKTADVELTKSFLEGFGLVFKEEKHGSGPLHYSCSAGDRVLEIYKLAEPPVS
jgi:lactoylglutathione lyase